MLAATAREAGAPLPLLSSTTSAGPTAAATSTTRPSGSRRSSASRTRAGDRARAGRSCCDRGGVNPKFAQRGRRGRSAQRRDDGARRLRRRARAPPCGAWSLPIHFGLAIVVEDASASSRSPSSPRRSIGSRAPSAASSRLELSESLRVASSRGPELGGGGRERLRPAAAPLPRRGQGGAARRALPRERGAPRVPRRRAASSGTKPDPVKLRDPRMWLRASSTGSGRSAAVPDLRCASARRPALLPVHDDRPHRPRPPRALSRRDPHGGDRRRPRRVRGLARRRRDLPARAISTPTSSHDRRVWVVDRFQRSARRAAAAEANGAANLVADLNTVRVGFATASASSTSGSASCRARSPRRSRRADRRARAAPARRRDAGGRSPRPSSASTTGSQPGGFVVVEHYGAAGCAQRSRSSARGAESMSRSSASTGPGASLAEATGAVPCGRARGSPASGPSARRSPARPGDAPELSVVVVFHNMRREAERTLHSLSRSYQQGIDDLDYEVSWSRTAPPRTSGWARTSSRGFGPGVPLPRPRRDSTPSPAHALNRGIAARAAR